MKFLIEIEGPGVDKPTPGESDPEAQIRSFVKALFKHVPGAKVSIVRAGPDAVLTDAKQLLKLQSDATVLRWLIEACAVEPKLVRMARDAQRGANEPI